MISPNTTCSWINIFVDLETTFQSTNQIWGFTVHVKFRLKTKVRGFYHLSFPYDFRDNLCVRI